MSRALIPATLPVVHWFYRADAAPLCGAKLRPLEPATPFSPPCAKCLRLVRQR
jgi:hypothetical protein